MEEIEVQSRVKQGDPLSATLFNTVIYAIIMQLDLRRNISTGLEQCSIYADDILTTTRKKQSLSGTCYKFNKRGNVHIISHPGALANHCYVEQL
jgi:hypothetical protein